MDLIAFAKAKKYTDDSLGGVDGILKGIISVADVIKETSKDAVALMKKEGLKNHVELHGYFNNILVAHLKTRGKAAIGWNEIISENLDSSAIPQVWTTNGAKKARKWCENNGYDAATIDGQLHFLQYEMPLYYPNTTAQLRACPNDEEGARRACWIFAIGYEVAGEYYAEMSMDKAAEYFNQ